MRRWGVLCLLLLLAGISGSLADDVAHPLSTKPTPLDPNQELVDAPLPGQKPADAGTPVPEGDASTLTPFYVRTGIGLSFLTSVDYPDFGVAGEVPMMPGLALGTMLGAQFHPNIAVEIEGGLLYNSVSYGQTGDLRVSGMNQVENVQLFQVPMLGNIVFRTDPLAGSLVRLVVGGGVGGIFRQMTISGLPDDITRSQTRTAYQGFGGIQINPGEPDLMVDVQFRYLNSIVNQSVPSMSIMGTVTIRF
jgi:hypothetical protein